MWDRESHGRQRGSPPPPAEIANAPTSREIDVLLAVLIEGEATFRAGEPQALGGSSRARAPPVALDGQRL
jgi:hypothetical protein